MSAQADGEPRKVFLIATEESGDRLGAALMDEMPARLRSSIVFVGVGGDAMTRAGLTSLFPVGDLAIIGFVAIVKRLPMILRRIREATEAVLREKPDILVIVDSPDFTHRVARRVRKADPSIPIVNYVSPTVWAWRPGRARAMRRYIDHVLALLPFEPEVHRRLKGPPCTYVGHPLAAQIDTLRPNALEQARRDAKPPVLLVLPGSRGSEIAHHMDIFGAALGLLKEQGVDADIVLPTVPHLRMRVAMAAASWPVVPKIVVEDNEKRAAFRTARAALAKSGTVTLELALAGVPMVTAYRATAIEAIVARRVVKVPSIILANLVLGDNVIPEYLQEDCTPEKLASALREVLAETPLRQRQIEAFARLDSILETPKPPSALAADIVINLMNEKPERSAPAFC